jgi:peptidoglycan/LPS O-acetylase OafA/YrhL
LLKSLTSFRFVAALMVFIYHVHLLKNYQLGYVGVSFFFVLSGFILTYNYHSKLTTLRKEQIKKFYIARLAKIYPVHVLSFIISIPFTMKLLSGFSIMKKLIAGCLNITLIQTYVPKNWINFSFNAVAWSLSNELFFYLLFPILIWGLLKIRNKKPLNALIIVYLIYLVITIASSLKREVLVDDWELYIFPFLRVFDFITGIILGLIFIQNKDILILSKRTFTLMESLSLLLLFVFITVSPHVNQGLRFSSMYLPIWLFLIYSFAFQRGYVSMLLSNGILVYLGEISFSFYMIHQLVIKYIVNVHLGHGLIILSFCTSVLLSSIIYHFYEEPLRKLIRFGNMKKSKEKNIKASA